MERLNLRLSCTLNGINRQASSVVGLFLCNPFVVAFPMLSSLDPPSSMLNGYRICCFPCRAPLSMPCCCTPCQILTSLSTSPSFRLMEVCVVFFSFKPYFPNCMFLFSLRVLLGLLACVINAVTLALIDAGIPMTDYVLALALAYDPASKSFLLDTNALEEQNPHKLPHFTVAMLHRSSKILSLLMDPPSKLPVDAFSQAMQAVVKGSLVLHQLLDQLVQNGKSQNLPSSTMVIE